MWGLEAWSAAGFQEGQVRPAHLRRVLTQDLGWQKATGGTVPPTVACEEPETFVHSFSKCALSVPGLSWSMDSPWKLNRRVLCLLGLGLCWEGKLRDGT